MKQFIHWTNPCFATKKRRRTYTRKTLRLESLETRQMLAAVPWTSFAVTEPAEDGEAIVASDKDSDPAGHKMVSMITDSAISPDNEGVHTQPDALNEENNQPAGGVDGGAIDRSPDGKTYWDKIDLKQKIDLQGIEEYEASFAEFANIYDVDDALLREVLALGSANVFSDHIARENIAGRLEVGPDFSIEEIGFGENMAAVGPVIRWRHPDVDVVADIGDEMAEKYCGKTAYEPDYNTATAKEVAEYQKNLDGCLLAIEWQLNLEGSPSNPSPTTVPVETSIWEDARNWVSDTAGDIWDWICDLFDTPAPDDIQGDHPLPEDLLTGLADATARTYQEFHGLHLGGDGRNPEYCPESAFTPHGYSRQDLEDAVSLGGGEGCGQSDEESDLDPNTLRRTFTVSNTIQGGCMGPDDLF